MTARFLIVHHANQTLITEGYEDRDGLSRIVQGFASVLQAHAQLELPCALHLSGTLLEAIAWSCPWFIAFVRKLRQQGIVELVGGTYSENIMTLADDESNRRQLSEFFRIFERHFGQSEKLEWCWVPERVWNTGKQAAVIGDPALPNGGYHGIFLDRRLLLPRQPAPEGLGRAAGDALGPWATGEALPSTRLQALTEGERAAWMASHAPHVLEDAGLVVAPISEHLRHWIPFRDPQDRLRLLDLADLLRTERQEDAILVFADDLERIAGVAGWDASGFRRYREFLPWLKSAPELAVTRIDTRAVRRRIPRIDPGAFYEFEHRHGGKEDGSGFTVSGKAREARALLEQSRTALGLTQVAEPRLLELGWKHFLASQYETLWHDIPGELAPWARALASHSRHTRMIVEAAVWFARPDRRLEVEERDIDGDGEAELLLKGTNLIAVLTARRGGRLVALFHHSAQGGRMMIGNPSDDWNLQCELHAFMKTPPNHPGAFCDLGGEEDDYEVETTASGILLRNRSLKSPWCGLEKEFSLDEAGERLLARYRLPKEVKGLTRISLSPDYLSLLRNGPGGAKISVDAELFEAGLGTATIRARVRSGGAFRPAGKIGHGWLAELALTGTELVVEVECEAS